MELESLGKNRSTHTEGKYFPRYIGDKVWKQATSEMISFTVLLLGVLHLSSAAFNYQTCPKLWNKIGCRTDLHHNLTLLIDDRTRNNIDWDNFHTYEHDLLCRCRQVTVAGGYKWFAVDPHGLCLAKLGDLGSYLSEFPLDDLAKCSGLVAQVPVVVPDGSSCIDGRFRPFFYTIETSVPAPVGGAPVGGAPEEEEEEEEQQAPEQEQEEQVVSCTTVADVMLVVDVSGSVGQEGFQQTKTFIKHFMDRFDFTNGTRIGIITYDQECQAKLDWTSSSGMTKASLKTYCDNLEYTGGSTRTDIALGCAKTIVQNQRRSNVPITIVVMTDGMTWGGSSTVGGPANSIRSLSAKIISIGVGNDVDPEELNTIAGSNDNVILKTQFSELNGPNFLNTLIAKSCSQSK